MQTRRPARRARLALVAFGYWHYGLLLGVVAVAAGLKKAIGDPYDPLAGWIGVELGVGVALFVWCTVGFCRTLGLGTSVPRLVAGAAALATIPIGTEWTAAAQLAALVAIVAAALVVEGAASDPWGLTPRPSSRSRARTPPDAGAAARRRPRSPASTRSRSR